MIHFPGVFFWYFWDVGVIISSVGVTSAVLGTATLFREQLFETLMPLLNWDTAGLSCLALGGGLMVTP